MLQLKTILHPTDLSEDSRYALDLACVLARDQKARLILLHILPRLPVGAGTGGVSALREEHTSADLKAYREEMAGQLEKIRKGLPLERVEVLIKEGEAARVIAVTAEETPCDLIVMGTHGRSGKDEMMMGSVAAQVARRPPCPVVTIAAPRKRY